MNDRGGVRYQAPPPPPKPIPQPDAPVRYPSYQATQGARVCTCRGAICYCELNAAIARINTSSGGAWGCAYCDRHNPGGGECAGCGAPRPVRSALPPIPPPREPEDSRR